MDKEYIDINKEFKETLERLEKYSEDYIYINKNNDQELKESGLSLKKDDEGWLGLWEAEKMMIHLLMFRFSMGNRLVRNHLMDDFFWDNWCFEIYKARHKLREITGWNMNNNSYNKKDIVEDIIDFYDDIYRDAVEYYLIEADTYPDLIYGTSYFPKTCPWNLQDLIRAPYRDLLKMIHDPKDEEDTARLVSRCKYIDEFARERREEEG